MGKFNHKQKEHKNIVQELVKQELFILLFNSVIMEGQPEHQVIKIIHNTNMELSVTNLFYLMCDIYRKIAI